MRYNYKFLEESIDLNLHDNGNGFLCMTSKVQTTKEKLDKLDFINIKNLCIKEHHQENEKTTQHCKSIIFQ